MRVDKFLSHLGLGSRKEVKELLKKEQVEVNQKRIKDGKYNVNETRDQVTLNGEVLVYQEFYYYMLHKPMGVISATEDRQHRTVLQLLKQADYRSDLFPIGRLDKDTTGLLLLTNDGPFSHRLLTPKKHVPKCYYAELDGIATVDDQEKFAAGLTLRGDEVCKPAKLEIVSVDESQQRSTIRLTITEGKYHQVKRMFSSVGKEVTRLHRETMGSLHLDESLQPGDYRELSAAEVEELNHPR